MSRHSFVYFAIVSGTIQKGPKSANNLSCSPSFNCIRISVANPSPEARPANFGEKPRLIETHLLKRLECLQRASWAIVTINKNV